VTFGRGRSFFIQDQASVSTDHRGTGTVNSTSSDKAMWPDGRGRNKVSESLITEQTAAQKKTRTFLDDAARCRASEPELARQLALDARVLARAEDMRSDEAEALYQLASIAHQAGQTDDAFALAAEAVELAEPNEASLTLAWSLHLIGVVYYQASNYVSALDHCLRALQTYRATGHDMDEGRILHTVAAIYQSMGDYDRAFS